MTIFAYQVGRSSILQGPFQNDERISKKMSKMPYDCEIERGSRRINGLHFLKSSWVTHRIIDRGTKKGWTMPEQSVEVSLKPVVRVAHSPHSHQNREPPTHGTKPYCSEWSLNLYAEMVPIPACPSPRGEDSLQRLSCSDYLLVELPFPVLLQLPPLVHIKFLNTMSCCGGN